MSSPGGSYPFLVTDVAESVFDFPGLYSIRVKVVDDDGGEDVDELPKLVTGDAVCIRSMGFWKHQFSGRGHQHEDDRMLVGYLEGINFASTYFSEVVPLTDIEKAGEVLDIQGQEMRDKAEAQLFAAWLNFMSGAVDWDDDIEMEDDEKGSIPFHQIIEDIENILLDPDASGTSLEQAKHLAETVNEIVEESSACEFDQEDLAEDEDKGENDENGEEKSGVDVGTPRNKKGRGNGSD